MANILGLKGFNRVGLNVDVLLAAFGNNIVNVGTGLGYGLAINSSNNVEFETFLDRVFFQNYSEVPLTFNGTVWSREYVGRTPISKYQKQFNSKLYLINCAFTTPQPPLDTSSNTIIFPSRIFFSDLFQGNTLTWGIEWGRNGRTSSGTNIFEVSQTDAPLVQNFKATNIKVGDPLFITNGSSALTSDKPYLVTSVASPYRLIVDRPFPVTTTAQHFWVGSNWLDVGTDDGDQLYGSEENTGRLLFFKLFSLWFYTGSQLSRVQGAIGTSSRRSVINDRKGRTYYFHGSDPKISGIYRYDGVSASKISREIDPYIAGMSASNFASVVVWEEGEELRWFLGNLSTTNLIDSMTNAVASYNTLTGAWSVDPIDDVITAATTWLVSSVKNSYCGTNDNQILKMDSGNSHNTAPIRASLETKVFYPGGSEIICEFPYVQVIGRYTKGTKVKYKLWDNPTAIDSEWWPLGELNEDRTEFTFPISHQTSSGIQFKFEELGTFENDTYIEKISLFYKPNRMRLL